VSNPKVSVIMNCYNSSTYLREAIESVYAQTYRDWEIIFWDNASTDNSAVIAKSFDEKLRYFHAEKTVPLGHARNLAIEKVRGEYIAFLDCDDLWLPEKLEKQIGFLESHIDVMMVYSDILSIDGNGKLIENYLEDKEFYRGYIFEELFLYNFICLVTVVLRKDILNKVGLFNTNYIIVEDYDLFLKIAESHKIDYLDESLAKYRIHGTNLCKNTGLFVKEYLDMINFWMNKRDFNLVYKFKIYKVKLMLYLRLIHFYLFGKFKE